MPRKQFVLFIQLLCLLFFLSQSVVMAAKTDDPMKSYDQPVVDQAKVLTPQQLDELKLQIKRVERKQKIKVAVCTVKKLPQGKKISDYAHQILNEQYSSSEKGKILLLVDMENRKWYVATSSKMKSIITDGKGIEKLKEAFLSDLSDGKYGESFTAFVESVNTQIDAYYEQKAIEDDPKAFSKLSAGIAGVLGLLLAAIFTCALLECMGNVKAAKEADDYLNKDSVNITKQKDILVGVTVVRVKRSSSSSGSSSGGGGGGGSF
ncbi:uncharacterized protein SAMN05216584_10869 [Selenomonas sp. WCT3]|uniref:TPM domain-containing protein n=1 Tax=Selenomonas sp. WCT3 TaxID=3158785 RepID=UPI00088D1A15|nr:uncharacterized protein SAMN05216584_10869 [Selenomonas ruminantium]